MRGKRLYAVLALTLVIACCAVWRLLTPVEKDISASSVGDFGLILLDSEAGPYVLAVEEGSAASQLGFLPGDLITAVGGQSLSTAAEIEEAVSCKRCDSFQLNRKGRRLALETGQ